MTGGLRRLTAGAEFSTACKEGIKPSELSLKINKNENHLR